jgi:hypothetical protein
VIVGACTSLIVTDCVALAVFPAASVAVHVTVVTPFGNCVGALFEYVTPGQLSETVGVPSGVFDKALLHWPASVPNVTGPGAVRTGAGLFATTFNIA